MCQAAPLPRCSNHTKKDVIQLEKDHRENTNQRLAIGDRIMVLREEAEAQGYMASSLSKAGTPGHVEHTKLREDFDKLKLEERKISLDLKEQQLNIDATPNGRKALKDTGDSDSLQRLRTAKELNVWHKELREKKDSNGVKLLSEDSDRAERLKLYVAEYRKAKVDYETAFYKTLSNDQLRDKAADKVSNFYGDSRYKPEAIAAKQELDRLIQEKKDLESQQILARAKINLVDKAYKNEKQLRNRKAKAKSEVQSSAQPITAQEYSNKLHGDLEVNLAKLRKESQRDGSVIKPRDYQVREAVVQKALRQWNSRDTKEDLATSAKNFRAWIGGQYISANKNKFTIENNADARDENSRAEEYINILRSLPR